MYVFPRIASGVTGLPESIASQALRSLCVCNLLFGGEDRRFLLARPSVRAIGEVVGGPTTREEASRRGGRWRGVSVFVRVGIVAAGGGVVYGTTRAEETSSPPPRGRRGWERLWVATGLVVPGVAEERHGELGIARENVWWIWLAPTVCRPVFYSQNDARTSVEPSGSPPSQFVEDVGLCSCSEHWPVMTRGAITVRVPLGHRRHFVLRLWQSPSESERST
jgi:hypothetical protein